MEFSNFDLNLLPVLVALYDNRSVTLAADQLGMSQPAVSKALSRLRQSLGDQLFVKTSLGMEPTARMSSMIEPMRSRLSSIRQDVLNNVAFDAACTKTTFTFALSEVGELICLPRLIKNLQQFAPHASLNTVFPGHDELIEGLENGKIDLAIGVYPELKKTNFFRQRISLSRPTCLICADHPMRRDRFTMKQYLELGHVMVRAGYNQQIFEKAFGTSGSPRNVALVISLSHHPEIVRSTDLVATVLLNLAKCFVRTYTNLAIVEAMRFSRSRLISLAPQVNDDPRNKWLRGHVREYSSATPPPRIIIHSRMI
jgi:DNA-binding transcriptional LysR family regulator